MRGATVSLEEHAPGPGVRSLPIVSSSFQKSASIIAGVAFPASLFNSAEAATPQRQRFYTTNAGAIQLRLIAFAPLGAARSLCRVAVQRYHFGPGLQLVKVVRPSLHHLAPLWQVFREVIGSRYLVALAVRQLPLDHRVRQAKLMQ